MARAPAARMDFFAHQDVARRRTSFLVFLFVVAVILIVAAVYLAFAGLFVGIDANETGTTDWTKLWNVEVLAWVAGVTLALVAIGSLSKMAQLRQGGAAVATLLGGRLLIRNTRDATERKLLNVVEEIAIASGTPVPPVYVLENERGINAFAAGFTVSDAVIGVTRGCMERLSRDELQGVIAHEFSHILNGDMRLNIRLMGVLNGILILAMAGYIVLRVGPHILRGAGRSRGKGAGGALGVALALMLFGLLVMIIGYVGVFFGKLIKSAVSRQREYLADSSAVQFTRQPSGLSGALKKIGGLSSGSRLRAAHAEEASHFYFANGLGSAIFNLMATHPPLLERVRRIEPSFDGDFRKYAPPPVVDAPAARRARETRDAGTPFGRLPREARVAVGAVLAGEALGRPPGGRYRADPDEVVASVGAPGPEHLEYASELIAALPEELTRAVSDPFGSRAVVYCLLLNAEPGPRGAQLKRLEEHADHAVYGETLRLVPAAERLARGSRLALLDMAIPSLRGLSKAEYDAFVANVRQLIAADERVDLFEYVVGRTIARHLKPSFARAKPPSVQYYSVNAVAEACGELLSCLAYRGADDAAAAAGAFARGSARLATRRSLALSPADSCGLKTLDGALDRLALASPAVKRMVLASCTACVGADGKVTVEEAELLRAVADSLDCPVPPFLPGSPTGDAGPGHAAAGR